jgi:predicted DNA-binding protein
MLSHAHTVSDPRSRRRLYPVILPTVKTAISLPDELFTRVEARAAELGVNRSEFFAAAASRYLDETDAAGLTTAVDTALRHARAASAEEARAVVAAGRDRLAALTAGDDW